VNDHEQRSLGGVPIGETVPRIRETATVVLCVTGYVLDISIGVIMVLSDDTEQLG
jgi:hypothetical protein